MKSLNDLVSQNSTTLTNPMNLRDSLDERQLKALVEDLRVEVGDLKQQLQDAHVHNDLLQHMVESEKQSSRYRERHG